MNNLVTLDLFAGAGGFGLGFSQAGYDLVCSIEKDKWACDTLRENNTHKILESNISDISDRASRFRAVPESPSIIIGGPPCQGFSSAGRKIQNDPRNKMYKEYLDWVKCFKPKMFVIENVKGILTFKSKSGTKNRIIDDIISRISELGYYSTIWCLNAAEYGVPQNRTRVFIIGHEKLENIPKPLKTFSTADQNMPNPISVMEAIGDLPEILAKQGSESMSYDKEPDNSFQEQARNGSPMVYNHVAMNHTERVVKRYQKIIDGEKLENLNDELKVRKRNGNGSLSNIDFGLNYRYLNPNYPSFTIPAHFYSSFIHPIMPRNITTREAARLQTFPDFYKFQGKRTQVSSNLLKRLGKENENYLSQYNQVGNAVPPLLSRKIGSHLLQFI